MAECFGESDERLVTAALHGDGRAFEQLVYRHYGLVYAIAYARLQSREQAEELAQDVFVRGFLLLEQLSQPALFAHWLTRTARNLAIDWQRKGSRATRLRTFVPLEDVSADLPDSRFADARSYAITREQLNALKAALQQMDCAERELLLLHYSEGLSHSEIADRLDVDKSTITKRLGRIVLALRALLAGGDVEMCTALRARRTAKVRTIAAIVAMLGLSQEARTALASDAQPAPVPPRATPARGRNYASAATRSLLFGLRAFALWLLWYVKVTAGVAAALAIICAGGYLFYSNVQAEVATSQEQVIPQATPAPVPSTTPAPVKAQEPAAGSPIAQLEQQFAGASVELGGNVGISVTHVESGKTAGANADTSLPLYSVFKLPLAVVVLKKVETGELNLDKKVKITKSDLSLAGSNSNASRWEKLPRTYTIRQLLQFSLMDSDNTACDKLLELVGGPSDLTRNLRELGFPGIEIKIATRDMGKYTDQPNKASASTLVQLLSELQKGSVLKLSEREVLFDFMSRARTGPHRIRGLLPAGTTVMHKTGTGDKASAINDVGLITLPGNAGHLAVAVFISSSKLTEEQQEQKLAELARAAYDAFTASR
jgi:beta-lactamase class A